MLTENGKDRWVCWRGSPAWLLLSVGGPYQFIIQTRALGKYRVGRQPWDAAMQALLEQMHLATSEVPSGCGLLKEMLRLLSQFACPGFLGTRDSNWSS